MVKTVTSLCLLGFLFGPAAVLLALTSTFDPAADAACLPAVGDSPAPQVQGRLMELRLRDGYPSLTAEQARNAMAIADVARRLDVPRFGLEIALATAIQESKLLNLGHGDADSAGLFQQRPSAGWGTLDQVTDPRLATLAFFGRAEHTDNAGLLDLPGWQYLDLAVAAQSVQISRHPDAYAAWEDVAGQMAAILRGVVRDVADPFGSDCTSAGGQPSYTLATLNLLGAGHTDNRPGGGHTAEGFPTWSRRLPYALQALRDRGVTVAGLQEVHHPQAHALSRRHSVNWGMWPHNGNAQNRVIWDRDTWRMTDARAIMIPYFGGREVGMPLVQLTSRNSGQVIWIWSVHNPASTRGNARGHRLEALRRQRATVDDLKSSGVPIFVVGDFNDRRDASRSAHCTLTPTLDNAFGPGGTSPCRPPSDDGPIDHIFGANVQFASATVDRSTQARKISDHPLVVATALGSASGCPPTDSPAERGLTPDALLVLRSVDARFGQHTYAGVGSRPNRSDHPAGRAVDVMIPNWTSRSGIAEGNEIAGWFQAHASALGVTYIIWRDHIWNAGDRAWSSYTHPNGPTSDPTLRHLNHVHVSVAGSSGTSTCDGA